MLYTYSGTASQPMLQHGGILKPSLNRIKQCQSGKCYAIHFHPHTDTGVGDAAQVVERAQAGPCLASTRPWCLSTAQTGCGAF